MTPVHQLIYCEVKSRMFVRCKSIDGGRGRYVFMLTNELITPLNLCHLTGMLRRSNVLWLRAISCQSRRWQQGPLFLHCFLIHTLHRHRTGGVRHVWNTWSVHTPENIKLQWKLQWYFNAFTLFLFKWGATLFFFNSSTQTFNPNLKTNGWHLRPLQFQSKCIIFTWIFTKLCHFF